MNINQSSRLLINYNCCGLSTVGESYAHVKLQAGDDAGDIAWTDAQPGVKLYASHFSFIEKTVKLRNGAW